MSSVLAGDAGSVAETRIDDGPLGAGPRTPGFDPAVGLARLRAEFPGWGFLFDPWAAAWVAVRGRRHIHVARSVAALRAAVEGSQ